MRRPAEVADCISTLAVRGAPAIGIAAAYGMALADDPAAAAELLRATRPTAVNLAWALEQALAAPDRSRGRASCITSRTRPTGGWPSWAPRCSRPATAR